VEEDLIEEIDPIYISDSPKEKPEEARARYLNFLKN